MPQRRLDCYFTPTRPPLPPSGRSFLDLPRSTRKRIYEYAGLGSLFVDLNYSNLQVYAQGMYPDTTGSVKFTLHNNWPDIRKVDVSHSDDIWEFCEDFHPGAYEAHKFLVLNRRYSLHHNLLLASKGVHEDMELLLYTGATFRVCLGQPLGFKRLWRMSHTALSNLTSLTIRLDTPKTTVKSSEWDSIFQTPPAPINLSLKWGRLILKEWTSILERLARFIKPCQLRLSVVFRAKTIEDATTILQPIAQLPPLKDCSICADIQGQDFWWSRQCGNTCSYNYLHCHPNKATELSNLVQKCIQELTWLSHPDPAPFRYSDLPQELRLTILEYTDLVSSDAVQWRPRSKLDVAGDFEDYIGCLGCITAGEVDDCTCRVYRQRGPPKNVDELDSCLCCNHCRPHDHSYICYCSTRDPIRSSSCKCLLPRHPLFSVSSQVRQDATQVYYSHNQILVTPYNTSILRLAKDPYYYYFGIPSRGVQDIPRIELSLYLSSIASNALQHIRWLEWAIPSQNPDYLLPKTPAWYDYLDTLLLMQNAMNISALTLTIFFTPKMEGIYMPVPPDILYKRVIFPVQRLGEAGLKDFFVYIRWYDDARGIDARGIVAHLEKDLEGAVMGEGYDSSARGKPVDRFLLKAMTARLRGESEFI